MVCSRIQPPLSRRECDKEKDHFKLGTAPIEPDKNPGTTSREEPANRCH